MNPVEFNPAITAVRQQIYLMRVRVSQDSNLHQMLTSKGVSVNIPGQLTDAEITTYWRIIHALEVLADRACKANQDALSPEQVGWFTRYFPDHFLPAGVPAKVLVELPGGFFE